MSNVRRFSCCGWLMCALVALPFCRAQNIKQTSVPLGNALTHALNETLTSASNSIPFHLKVHVFEATNPPSDYRAEIEEYWVSPKQWRRSIDSPGFKQMLIVNGDRVSEQNTGEYYPLWLKRFVIGIFDPVSNAEQWNKLNAKINQISLPNGQQSQACARAKFQVGSDTVKNDAFSNLCFDGKGLLAFIGSPGYSMEFHDYEKFGKKMIARRYQDDPESGTEIVAKVVLLEELKKPDASLFLIAEPTPPEKQLESIEVGQATIEQAAQGQPPIIWPAAQSGKTTGLLSMYISVDRDGRVREAYPLNADNAGLQDAARDQLLKWKLKPMSVRGKPVQAQAALSFHFDATLAATSEQPKADAVHASPASAAASAAMRVPATGFVRGALMSQTVPNYPEEAKGKRIQGKVVLELTIDANGVPQDIHMISSPDQSLTDSAIEAVTQWRYEPSRLNGVPVSIKSTVEVNFQNP